MAKSGFGATFQISATAITGSTGALAGLTSVPLPSITAETIETSDHSSPGRMRQFIKGMSDTEEMTLEMNMTPGSLTDTTCEAAAASPDEYFYKVTAGGQSYSQKCLVIGYTKGEVGIDGLMTASLEIKPSGLYTVAAAV